MTSGQTQKICPVCRTINRPDCRFCTSCGQEFPKEKTCLRCNATLSVSQRFCNACGAPADQPAPQQTTQMKFCHQCRALINRDAKFCGSCGTVIAELPICPRCGDPIGPEEKFCGVCGMPFEAATPARQAPILPPVYPPPPVQYSPPVKQGGRSYGKIAVAVILVIMVIAAIIMFLPDSTTPPPGGGDGGTTPYEIKTPTGDDPALNAASADASSAMLKKAADALANGDGTSFVMFLTSSVRARTGDTLQFTSDGAQNLATALRNAQVVESTPKIVTYRMEINKKTYTFYTVKEGGSWLIGGI